MYLHKSNQVRQFVKIIIPSTSRTHICNLSLCLKTCMYDYYVAYNVFYAYRNDGKVFTKRATSVSLMTIKKKVCR